ncbi:membrane protein involved in bacteriocin uptake [Paenibacillus terrae HPL-003]|uniref:Membrane protein involved in bacteriocin uptake n=1 Tax=Paenibacillus terrae (strain HPL-003) TaxID=985665 RepID=G7W4T3_PAETH|nr:membrane protein [Paenibacillus terrae]AET60483.1 membrane protein involved in bacteriocin uptake [Paenibacillus terrae HPL-003]
MSFQPNPGDELIINDTAYVVGRHPAAPGLAYAQAGRQGIVYQLNAKSGEPHEAKALKVFFPKFRIPAMVYQSEHMEAYGDIPGLQVCKRDVLTPERNGSLIAEQPDLLYAVLMPWIHGTTWFDCLTAQQQLEASDSLALARALAGIGSAMEQKGLAHCDLSAPNVMLPFFSEVELPEGTSAVELVDVEQMYSTKMDRPDALLAGSPGYAAHRTVHSGLWSAYADRFAGAIIIGEMLGWSDRVVVDKAWGESYFDQHEMQTPCERYYILRKSLESRWGSKLVELFSRAWDSQDLSSCPTFGEWLVVLNALTEQEIPVEVEAVKPEATEAAALATGESGEAASSLVAPLQAEQAAILNQAVEEQGERGVTDKLFRQARELEKQNKPAAALEVYRSLYHFVEDGSPLHVEVSAAIMGLEEQLNPKPLEQPEKSAAWYRSKTFIVTTAAAVVLLAVGIPAVNILADQSNQRQIEAAKQEEAKKAAEAKLAAEQEAAQKALTEKQGQEAEQQAKQQALAVQKQQEEQKKQQALVAQQVKYEAYLAQKEQNKQAAAKLAKQKAYDQQAKYEKYLAWKKDQSARAAQEEAARKAAAEAKQKQKASIQASNKRNVLQLISLYNKAYASQEGGSTAKAKGFANRFRALYESNSSYYRSVGEVGYRASSIYNFLSDTNFRLPKI